MKKKVDIIIVGAGLIGSALALTLVQRNPRLSIAVVERSAQLSENVFPNQRVVALGRVATDILDSVGVLEQLGSEFANPYSQMFIWDENSHGELAFNAQEHGIAQLGYMIDSVQCTLLLQQKVSQQASIQTHFACQAQSFKRAQKGVNLDLGDHVISAPLIVAADGASSWLRKQAKIFANHRSYNQQGIVAKIKTQEIHQNTAWQRFLSSGPLALLPLADNQCSIVWSVDESRSAELMSMNEGQFTEQLSQALGCKLGKISILSKPVAFPLISQQAEKYFVRNVVLVGDAAHSIHPLAGQGANLGFKDIQALTDILMQVPASSFDDIQLLDAYQRKRKIDNEQTDFMMSALHHAYQDNVPTWLTLRGTGMNMINRSTGLKDILIKQAVGD